MLCASCWRPDELAEFSERYTECGKIGSPLLALLDVMRSITSCPLSASKPTLLNHPLPALAPRLALLWTHTKHPHQRIQRHPQIANVVGLPVQRLLIRADDAVDQQRRPTTG